MYHLPLKGYRENRGATILQTEAAHDKPSQYIIYMYLKSYSMGYSVPEYTLLYLSLHNRNLLWL